MPTYEFECESCGRIFEQRRAITDESGAACPECGAAAQQRISGGSGFILKAGGSRSATESCSLETTGRTCCGRDARCGEPRCGES